MTRMFLLAVLALSLPAFAQDQKPATLKGILLEQLRTTHNQKDWFVPANTAVEGLTANKRVGKMVAGITRLDS